MGDFGSAVADALGIKRMTHCTIDIPIKDCVRARVEFLLSEDQAKKIVRVLNAYRWEAEK
jgi:hypothetical protein